MAVGITLQLMAWRPPELVRPSIGDDVSRIAIDYFGAPEIVILELPSPP
jgi:hypothetical protein